MPSWGTSTFTGERVALGSVEAGTIIPAVLAPFPWGTRFGACRTAVSWLAFTNIGLHAFSVVAVLRTDGDTTGAVGAASVSLATNLHRPPLGNHLCSVYGL